MRLRNAYHTSKSRSLNWLLSVILLAVPLVSASLPMIELSAESESSETETNLESTDVAPSVSHNHHRRLRRFTIQLQLLSLALRNAAGHQCCQRNNSLSAGQLSLIGRCRPLIC
jgi:hypothetical protein